MGCGVSKAPHQNDISHHRPEPSRRVDVDGKGRAHWERTKLAADQQWTAHSTNAVAKHAMAQGLPEPPECFFDAQEHLVALFLEEGELQFFEPKQVTGATRQG